MHCLEDREGGSVFHHIPDGLPLQFGRVLGETICSHSNNRSLYTRECAIGIMGIVYLVLYLVQVPVYVISLSVWSCTPERLAQNHGNLESRSLPHLQVL